ncbi:hypothetical protein GCM10011342_25350 [Aquisalinus flavus]|uniref:Uncharacterized protein n=2 Tax=Aquisalinus flavus TaxID=1526572 RepID=A0A8J2V5S3_9PROT|nr:hypothetical protein GCM10011342_25350 [Aquisalinus flavus]
MLAYWYIRNADAGRDGALGPLALKDDDGDGGAGDTLHVTGAAAIRARVQGQDQNNPGSPETETVGPANAVGKAAGKAKAYRPREDR